MHFGFPNTYCFKRDAFVLYKNRYHFVKHNVMYLDIIEMQSEYADLDLVKIFPYLVVKFLKKSFKEMRCHAS